MVNDCPSRKHLCTNDLYRDLMKRSCPETCGYCHGAATSTTPAGDEWQQFGDLLYRAFENDGTAYGYAGSASFCENEQAIPVQPKNEEQETFSRGLVPPTSSYYLNIRFEDGKYVYNDDKQTIVYSNWHYPFVGVKHAAGGYYTKSFVQSDVIGLANPVAICQKPSAGACSPDWTASSDMTLCYKRLDVAIVTIYDARDACSVESATLPLPASSTDLSILQTYLAEEDFFFFDVKVSDSLRTFSTNQTITAEDFTAYTYYTEQCTLGEVLAGADERNGWDWGLLGCFRTPSHILCQKVVSV